MLILTRKPGESLYIGDEVKVIIVEIKGHQIRIGIEAPASVRIYREEIYLQIMEENRQAAETAAVSDSALEGLSSAWSAHLGQGTAAPSSGSGLSRFSAQGGKKAADPQVVIKRRKKGDNE